MERILPFLDKYFPVIMTVNAFCVAAMALIVLFIWVRFIRFATVLKVFNRSLFFLLLFGEVALLAMTGMIFIDNYRKKEPLDFSARVLAHTDWVEEKLDIYFIAENTLSRVDAKGKTREKVFTADDPIVAYHFSPDGRYLLIATVKDLVLYDRRTADHRLIDTWQAADLQGRSYQGVVDGIQWAPQNDRFCYRIGRWTRFSSQENWYVFDLKTGTKRGVKSPTRPLNALSWDEAGENLYYSWFDALDTSVRGNPFEVKVFRIPLETLEPRLVLEFPFDQATLSREHLALRGIRIFAPPFPLSFGREGERRHALISAKGAKVSIDPQDHLVYTKNRWWRRRLFRIPRVPDKSDIPRHQYQGGRLAVRHMRWLPSGKYLIMEHDLFGILILYPATGRIGIVVNEVGNTFGWYPEGG